MTHCETCGHPDHEHGEESSTQLEWAVEYWPHCTHGGCQCGQFVDPVAAGYARLEAALRSIAESRHGTLHCELAAAARAALDREAQDPPWLTSA